MSCARAIRPGDWLGILALTILGLVALHPVLAAGFVLVDDHEILSFDPQVRNGPELESPPDVVTRVLVNDAANGRVRPLFWVLRYAEIGILGSQPTLWHWLYLGLGVLAGTLFYLTLRSLKIGWFSAFLAAAWLLVVPGVSSVWIRLGPQESLATVLLCLGGLATTVRVGRRESLGPWDWIFVLSVSGAALIKESFALAPPAMLAFRVFVVFVERGKQAAFARAVLFPGLVTVGVGVMVVAAALITTSRSQSGSYGNETLAAALLGLDATTPGNLEVLALSGGVAAPVLTGGMLFESFRRRHVSPTSGVWQWLAGAGIVCLLVLPQLVLYRSHGGFAAGRYLLPAGLAMAAGVAAGTEWSRRLGQRRIVVAVTSLWTIILIMATVETRRDAEHFRVDSVQLNRMLDALTHLPPGAEIALVTNPLDREFAVSLPFHLAARGRPDVHTRYIESTASPEATDCSGIAAVVLFPHPAEPTRAPTCAVDAKFRLETFSESVSLGNYVPGIIRDLLPPAQVEYAVLFRRAV